jgi:hypothetical protein
VAYLVRLKNGKIVAFEAQTNRSLCALRKRLNPVLFKIASFAQIPVLVELHLTSSFRKVFISKCKMVGTFDNNQVMAAWSVKPGKALVLYDVFEEDSMIHAKDVEFV